MGSNFRSLLNAEARPGRLALVGGTLVGVLAVSSGVAVARSARSEIRPAGGQKTAVNVELGHAAVHGYPLRTAILEPNLPTLSPNQVPPITYLAALRGANGDVNKAELLLIDEGIPPLPVDDLSALAEKLDYKSTLAQEEKADATVSAWSERWRPGTPLHLPKKPAAKMFEALKLDQQKDFQHDLLGFFDSQLNVHEAYKNKTGPDKGEWCNCGAHIDDYTAGHKEKWCADFVSYALNAIGYPLNGGAAFGRPDWQIPRAHDNPSSPELGSMMSWFEDNAYFFTLKQRMPKPGDVVVLRYAGENGQKGDADDGWHVMFVLGFSKGRFILGGGNTGDAVSTRIVSMHSPNIVGFGSFFPDKQSPSAVILPRPVTKPAVKPHSLPHVVPKLPQHLIYPRHGLDAA